MSDNPFPVSNASNTVVNFATQLDSSGSTIGIAALAVVNGGTAQVVTDLNPVPVETGKGTIVPAPASNTEIVTGGTAVVVASGPIKGGYVTNPANAAAQGIVTAEGLYVDPINSPGGTDAAANGTTTLLVAGATYAIPALAAGQQLRANAASSGHKFTSVTW